MNKNHMNTLKIMGNNGHFIKETYHNLTLINNNNFKNNSSIKTTASIQTAVLSTQN